MKTGFHPARELAEASSKKALLHEAGTTQNAGIAPRYCAFEFEDNGQIRYNRPVPSRLYPNETVSANMVVGKSRGRPTARAETQVPHETSRKSCGRVILFTSYS